MVRSNFRGFNFGHMNAVRKLNPHENNRLYGNKIQLIIDAEKHLVGAKEI